MTRFAMLAAVIGAVGLSAVADDKKAEFDGGYTIVSGEKDGQPIPEDHIKGQTVRFTGNKIVSMDKDSKETYVSTFTADAAHPKMYKLKTTTPKEAESMGMIEKTGDTLKLIYALPGGDAPTEFKTKKGQQMFVLKNMNKEKKDR